MRLSLTFGNTRTVEEEFSSSFFFNIPKFRKTEMRKLLLLFICISITHSFSFGQSMISGYVIELTNGFPIKNATVFLHDEFNIALKNEIRTQTDEFGYYEFKNLDIRKYSVNAFVYYEFQGDSIAYVIQPGFVTLSEDQEDSPIYTVISKDEETGELVKTYTGFRLNFGFSESYFKLTMNPPDEITFSSLKERALYSASLGFIRPRIQTNNDFSFTKSFTSYTQKKTW